MNSKLRHLLILLLAGLSLSGCLPEERVWWSPLGDRALVVIEGRLHLVQVDGVLGPPLADDAPGERAEVKSVSWLPDGSGFVCQRVRTIRDWEKTRALIPEAEAKAVEAMQPAVLPLLEAAVRGIVDAKSMDDVVSSLPLATRQRFGAAVRRHFQEDPTAIGKLLQALPHGSDVVASLKKPEDGYELSEFCVIKLDGQAAAAPRSLARSLLNPMLLPRVSPKHDAVAYLRLAEDGESAALEVLALDGGAGLTVAGHVSGAFEWMPDGRSLVFTTPIGGDGEKLQSIHRVVAIQESGALMKPRRGENDPDRLAETVTLATAVALSRPALAALADGRVLFASQAVTLPAATSTEMESRLFVINADGAGLHPVPTAPGDLPANLAFFTVSPDGRRVAVVESETDAVAVVEVESGKTKIISPPHPRWQCTTLPAWKSATELTFAALHGATPEPKWMLWSTDGGVRCISEKWPAAATAKWLEYKADHKPARTTSSLRSLTR